ncbi:hypothetical protein ACFLRC_03135, partial [Candidatus Altiarchaeota archaeon]
LEPKSEKKVRVLNPKKDYFRDMPDIVGFYVERKIPIYVLVRSKRGILLDPEWITQVNYLQENYTKAEITTINIQWPYRIEEEGLI